MPSCRDSHAYYAGLSENDILLEIDGESVIDKSHDEVVNMMKQGILRGKTNLGVVAPIHWADVLLSRVSLCS
jgi:C-terminal processing protease CtpA/Prc